MTYNWEIVCVPSPMNSTWQYLKFSLLHGKATFQNLPGTSGQILWLSLFSRTFSLTFSLISHLSSLYLILSFSLSSSHLSLSSVLLSLSLFISLFVDTFPRKLGLVPRFVSKANLGRDATFCRYSSTWDKEGGNCKHFRAKLSQGQTQGEKLSVTKLHQSLVRKLRDYAKTTLGQTQVEWETLQFNGHSLQSLHTSRFQASPIIVEAKVPTLSPAFSFSLSSGICLSDMFRSKDFRIV